MDMETYSLPLPDGARVYEALYVAGGYNSIDKGVPDWGANNEHDALLIGDRAGELVIAYADGTADAVPLIFGYTLWWRERWNDLAALPFKGEGADEAAAALLRRTLCLCGAFEGEETCLLGVRPRAKQVASLTVRDNTAKMGRPVFTAAEESSGRPDFFAGHMVDAADPLPDRIQKGLDNIFALLYHTEEDLMSVLPPETPPDFPAPPIAFAGGRLADILTNVLGDNCRDMVSKIDPDGALNASSRGSPCWGRYDGFGTWVPDGKAGYYGKVYSRDGGRAGMALLDAGYAGRMDAVMDYYNDRLMFFPRSGLTFGGRPIPGHWTVIVNEPLIYSEYLTGVGWPTQYTRERFGEECGNLGNQETDGHGLVMLAAYKQYLTAGSDPAHVRRHWAYIREAASFIVWCLDNPELSLARDGVLYGETEAAMNDYTLYANIPCCLAMGFYADMAGAAGYGEEAALWRRTQERMKAGIERRFAADIGGKPGWDLAHCGFYHDPVPTMLADFYGGDIRRFPYPQWVERSVNSYEADIARYVKDTYAGPRGLGYDFNIITQNALLLDRTADYTGFLHRLAKVCYAPKLPHPYLTPEGTTVLPERGVYRRHGDLGNLAQQSETVKTLLMAAGLYRLPDGTVALTPRTPDRAALRVEGAHVANSHGVTADLDMRYEREAGGPLIQHAALAVRGHDGPVVFRAGPFAAHTVEVTDGGAAVLQATYPSGDARWLDIAVAGGAGSYRITEVEDRAV